MAGQRRWLSSIGTIAVAAVTATGFGGCGDDDDGGAKVSAASLKSRLLPVSIVRGYRVERTLDWSDPVDLIGEGIFLPQAIHPSRAVKQVRDAGFEGAAGEILARGRGPDTSEIHTGVIKLDSAGGARRLRDWMHARDLEQPCFGECIFGPRNLPVPEIPGAHAVEQVPQPPPPGEPEPPPGEGPPTRYLIEFPVGKYLYFAVTEAGAKDRARFIAGARDYYQRVKRLGG